MSGDQRGVARVIDGKAVGQKVRDEVKERVAELKARGIEPGLATVLVGDDPASAIYVRMKHKACLEAGMKSFGIELPASTTEAQLLEVVDGLNARSDVHGILVQLPVPQHIEAEHVIDRISPAKDVDGLHAKSRGLLVAGVPRLRPRRRSAASACSTRSAAIRRARTRSSSDAACWSASRSRCCCSSVTRRSPSATRARRTSARRSHAPTSSSRRSARRARSRASGSSRVPS